MPFAARRPSDAVVALLVATLAVAGPALPASGQPATVAVAPAAADTGDEVVVRYEAPVPGDVLRGFEPPATTMGPGHRGVDLAALPGAAIRSAAAGVVTFAGSVAGTTWVSVSHADGIVTSYGPVTSMRVVRGQAVTRGEPLARLAAGGHGHGGADRGVHWGARRDGRYLDPLTLLDGGIGRPSLVGDGTWRGADHVVRPYAPWPGGGPGGWTVAASPTADRPGFATPPNPNHLVLLPGLSTSSATRILDPEHLGLDPRSVTEFSYAGRHDDEGDPDDPRRDQLPYGPEHTWAGIDAAAEHLAEQLREHARREPGRPVDLVGHSMGGVTIVRYLLEHHDAYDRSLPPIGHVVTIASPLHGSDVAAIGATFRDDPLVGPVARHLQRRWGVGAELPLDAPAVDQLAVGSPELWDLAVAWEQALADGAAGPLGAGTRVLTIGGSRDLVVSSDRARQPDTAWHAGTPPSLGLREDSPFPSAWATHNGTTADLDGQRIVDHRVLPGGHDSVLRTEAVREVVWRFLAGEEVVDSPGRFSTIVGGQLLDGARLGTQLLTLHGPVADATRPGP